MIEPKLIALLRLGCVISGECSVCHEIVIFKGVATDPPEHLSVSLTQAFSEHIDRHKAKERGHPETGMECSLSDELARLLAEQAEFLTKKTQHTFIELQEFEVSRERVRQLFAEWRDQRGDELSN